MTRARIRVVCILATAILGSLVPAFRAEALEEPVDRRACMGAVWLGLVDRNGESFINRGQCISSANQGGAFTDPRFTHADAVRKSTFTLELSFREIGMLPGDLRSYLGFATLTLTDACRPLGSSPGDPTIVRSSTTQLGASPSATVDESGAVNHSFEVRPITTPNSPCGFTELGSRNPTSTFTDVLLVDRGKFGTPIVYSIPGTF